MCNEMFVILDQILMSVPPIMGVVLILARISLVAIIVPVMLVIICLVMEKHAMVSGTLLNHNNLL